MDQLPPIESSQQKRKFIEYHDPDYPEDGTSLSHNSQKKRAKVESTSTLADTVETEDASTRRIKKLRDIIKREFQNEIEFKETQLAQIDERLVQARTLLDRLRYSIVVDFYRKQSVPLTKPEADTIRGNQTLFTEERASPQLPLHPSLKKIIGKRPRSYEELVRTHPERMAAKQARKFMRERNPAQRRHERRIQNMIREQGIVIDHSKVLEADEDAFSMACGIKMENEDSKYAMDNDESPCTSKQAALKLCNSDRTVPHKNPSSSGKQVNASRNKTKYLFVVGNTSKYIGAEVESAASEFKSSGQKLSHKWLVYVQGKDLGNPVEKFIKKVRFHLHPSYRPNDIVDVCSPPFQIARRGWGEFPMRLQLYFQEHLQQKPVQLLHNLVLDKTMSGLHTMGAETVVEIWLRVQWQMQVKEEKSSVSIAEADAIIPLNTEITMENPKPRTISITQNKEELDDTLFAFLSNIDMSPDIEKIQPTVVVPEPLECKIKITSPQKQQAIENLECPVNTTVKSTIVPVLATPDENSAELKICKKETSKLNNTQQFAIPRITRIASASITPIISTAKPTVMYLTKSKNNGNHNSNELEFNCTKFMPRDAPSQRSMRLVDANGKVAILPLSTTKFPVVTQHAAVQPVSSLKQNLIPSSDSTLENNGLKVKKSYKSVVFQREGKVYIIDPLQIKLKQAQKQQQSLLKPQISLLRQQKLQKEQEEKLQQQEHNLKSVTSDHDYAPPPPSVLLRLITPKMGQPQIITHQSIPPPLYDAQRKLDSNTMNLQKQRQYFEQRFHCAEFSCMRAAVEYLLRRLTMYAERGSLAAEFPFVCRNLQEFQSLNVIKQRAVEWLRAKCVQQYMYQHPQLKHMNASGTEQFWSAREIAIYARLYAYTPVLKPLNSLRSCVDDALPFATLVQNAVKQETINYETLTSVEPISKWINNMLQRLQDYEYSINDSQILDVETEETSLPQKKELPVGQNVSVAATNSRQTFILPPPPELELVTELVRNGCKEAALNLAFEELQPGIWHPAALTTLSQALKIFVERLVRQSVANKQQQIENGSASADIVSAKETEVTIMPQDIGRVIALCSDFDFLSNNHLGNAAQHVSKS